MRDITLEFDFKDNWMYFVLINIFAYTREMYKSFLSNFFNHQLSAEQENY